MTPVPSYADVMPKEEFLTYVRTGAFVDYDGFGHPVVDGKEDDSITVKPSRKGLDFPVWATHVAWYNR